MPRPWPPITLPCCELRCPVPSRSVVRLRDTRGRAGLRDRLRVLESVASLATFLCARFVVPPPCALLDPRHAGHALSCNTSWTLLATLRGADVSYDGVKASPSAHVLEGGSVESTFAAALRLAGQSAPFDWTLPSAGSVWVWGPRLQRALAEAMSRARCPRTLPPCLPPTAGMVPAAAPGAPLLDPRGESLAGWEVAAHAPCARLAVVGPSGAVLRGRDQFLLAHGLRPGGFDAIHVRRHDKLHAVCAANYTSRALLLRLARSAFRRAPGGAPAAYLPLLVMTDETDDAYRASLQRSLAKQLGTPVTMADTAAAGMLDAMLAGGPRGRRQPKLTKRRDGQPAGRPVEGEPDRPPSTVASLRAASSAAAGGPALGGAEAAYFVYAVLEEVVALSDRYVEAGHNFPKCAQSQGRGADGGAASSGASRCWLVDRCTSVAVRATSSTSGLAPAGSAGGPLAAGGGAAVGERLGAEKPEKPMGGDVITDGGACLAIESRSHEQDLVLGRSFTASVVNG